MQVLLVFLLFILAMAYLANFLRKQFLAKDSGCTKGCGDCGSVGISKKSGKVV